MLLGRCIKNFNTKFVIAKFVRFKTIFAFFAFFQYKICYSKISLKGDFSSFEAIFQYKICYSKIIMENGEIKHFVTFQYKICYSKMQDLKRP